MIQTIEAAIDEYGEVHLSQPVQLSMPRRALVMILEEPAPADVNSETALLSEAALGADWNRPEEEDAWSHLQ